MYKGLVTDVFFDLDHTLWDFERNSALTFEKIFESHKLALDLSDFLEIYIPINHRFWKLYREEKITKEALRYQRLKQAFDQMGHSMEDATIHLLSESYINHLSDFGHVFPNTFEILDYLKTQYNLHIITNGFQEVQGKKLFNAGIHHYFDHVIDSEMAGVKKPNPLIFELALKKAGVVPDRAVMIGDNMEADIRGAKAVGMHAIHFNSNAEETHHYTPIITDLGEINQYL